MKKMKDMKKAVVLAIMAVMVAGTSLPVLADWDPGDEYKMHHPQLPDPNGVDVDWGFGALGDDWQCIETGNVDDIHFWISWFNDIPMDIPSIHVSIWSNNPQGINGWSEPLDLLWQRTFQSGEFVMRQYGTGDQQWMMPWGEPIQQLHFGIYQINIVDIINPFPQEVGEIYWLVIEMPWAPPYTIGWKTSMDWFMDHPVWMDMGMGMWMMIDGIEFAFVITGEPSQVEREFGDAPEDGIAYPSSGTSGAFPTCKTCGSAGWIQHNNFGAWFGPTYEFETDGNAGLCPGGFPPYDQDECFQDNDAGLIIPEPFTIDATGNVIPCPAGSGTPLGTVGQTAIWGTDIDIEVHNHMPSITIGYVNVIMDWNQDGDWMDAGEHVLVDQAIPNPYDGPLSGLMAAGTGFLIGPNPGHVWSRFTITEVQLGLSWYGEGSFEDGETEDYMLLVKDVVSWPNHKMHHPQTPKPGGWDVEFAGSRLADDWECSESGPVTDIHFWVSWMHDYWQSIEGFTVTIWSDWSADDPENPYEYSVPHDLLWSRDFYAGEFMQIPQIPDLQDWYDPSSGQFGFDDHVTWDQINIEDIDEPLFIQEEGNIYWLEIDFWSLPNIGWKETDQNWNDDAVFWYFPDWIELKDPIEGTSIDLAFVITGGEEPPEITAVTITHSDPKDTSLPDNPIGFIGGWENFTCTVTDDVAVDVVQLNITYPDLHTEYILMTNIPTTNTYYHNTTLSDHGNYTYHVWADDTSDNQAESTSDIFSLPPNWDVNMDGCGEFWDLIAISFKWTDTGANGWVREDVDNGGMVEFWDLIGVSFHWGETWW